MGNIDKDLKNEDIIEKNCKNCFYGVNAVNDELTWCMYLGDLINSLETEKLGELLKHHIFEGSIYEGFLKQGNEEQLKKLMADTSRCKNFKWR